MKLLDQALFAKYAPKGKSRSPHMARITGGGPAGRKGSAQHAEVIDSKLDTHHQVEGELESLLD